jgi:Ca2+-binding EF-hand superfamily protein
MYELTASSNLHDELRELLACSDVDHPIVVSRKTLRTVLERIDKLNVP